MNYHQQVEQDPLHYLHNTKSHEDFIHLSLPAFAGDSIGTAQTEISDRQHLVPGDTAREDLPVQTGAVAKGWAWIPPGEVLPQAQDQARATRHWQDMVPKAAVVITFTVWLIAFILALVATGCTTAYKPKTFKTSCNVKMVSA